MSAGAGDENERRRQGAEEGGRAGRAGLRRVGGRSLCDFEQVDDRDIHYTHARTVPYFLGETGQNLLTQLQQLCRDRRRTEEWMLAFTFCLWWRTNPNPDAISGPPRPPSSRPPPVLSAGWLAGAG